MRTKHARARDRLSWWSNASCLALAAPLAVVFTAGLSQAAARYQKASGEIQVQAVQTSRTKVTKKTGESPQARRPTLMAEQFRAAAQAKVSRLTDQAISTLKRLIQVTPENDPEKPDFFFRLAEHYRDKKEQFMFAARGLDETIYQTESEAQKASLKDRQKGYERLEHQWMLEAIKMYLTVATKAEYAKYKRMDEVLYNVADMLNQANRRDKARIFFGKLIKDYPQSKYIPDAYLSFAEFYFNEGQVENALRLYQQVARYPDAPVYGYAMYKQGWCWLNLKEPRRALEMFVTVIRDHAKWGGAKKTKIVLVKEAKKDAVRAYSQVGTPDKAWPFFQRIGGDFAMTMLERLASLYYDQGKFEESVMTFRKLIALSPKSTQLCSWQYNIVKATLSLNNKREHVVEAKRLAAVYQTMKGRGDMKKTAMDECRANASGVLRELATTWHREAQKTQNQDTYDLAQYLYKEYLDTFPNEKDTYTMAYYYAELLFKLEKWVPAAEAYTKVVSINPKGKYLQDAAYAAVICWKNALNIEEERRDSATGKDKKKDYSKPETIPENQQKMLTAFDTYVKYVPQAKELVPIIYRKARIYYDYNHHDKAVNEFAIIVTKHSKHELAGFAANLMLDSLGILKRFDDIDRWVERFSQNPDLMAHEDLKKTCQVLKVNNGWTRAEALRKTGDPRLCGEAYAKLANENQEDPRWTKMLFNAAMCFEASKLIGQAIQIRDQLIKVKPKDPLAQKAMLMIGQNYHALSWYSRAATYYEQFATEFSGENDAAEAMQNAIVFRMGQGEYDKAKEDAEIFAKNYGGRKKYDSQTAAVYFSLGSIYETRKDHEGAVKHYESYLKKYATKGGLDRQIRAHVKIGSQLWSDSCPKAVNGACVKITRVRSARKLAKATKKKKGKHQKKGVEMKTQCGPETKMKVTVMDRERNKAKKAQTHFKQALALLKKAQSAKLKGADKEEQEKRHKEMMYAAAEAQFALAEAQFEDFLNVDFPKGLDFSAKDKKKAEKSKKEFAKFLETKGKKLSGAREMYQDVIKMKVAQWAIAGAARIGQLYQNFADGLYTAPIPKPPVPKSMTGEARDDFISMFTDAYCDKLEDEAGKLETKAVEGLSTCLSKSTDLSWYNEWSSLCEAELNQIKPAEFPIASEIRAQPGYAKFSTDRAKLITNLQ